MYKPQPHPTVIAPHRPFSLFLAPVLVVAVLQTAVLPSGSSGVDRGPTKVLETYGQLPLSFEANLGQIDGQVKFLSRGSGYSLFLTPTEAVLALLKPAAPAGQHPVDHETRIAEAAPSQAIEQAVLRMRLVGATPAPRMQGREELPGKVNYFLGSDPAEWRTNVPLYAGVKYEAVYPGVDLVYYGNQRQLEYDFVVAPGVDPEVIRLSFVGVDRLEVDARGELVLHVASDKVQMRKPAIYQERDGIQQEIAGGYVLRSSAAEKGGDLPQVGFWLGRYDANRPLVIDPVLAFSTYLGGSGGAFVHDFAVDTIGSAYIVGDTFSAGFPAANAVQSAFGGGSSDVFVTKLNATGGFVYSTYLGGSDEDSLATIVVDAGGNAYVSGGTFSTDFPTVKAVQATFGGGSGCPEACPPDAFVTKLNATGRFVYSTYLGGNGVEYLLNFAADASGNAYAVGNTTSTNFPTANAVQAAVGGSQDVFVTKLKSTGGFAYSTYLGGSNLDRNGSLAVDASGDAYVTGHTRSTNFPTKNAVQATFGGQEDVFVTKFNANGGFVYSTYLGGNGAEGFRSLAADASDNAYVVGNTTSPNFPTRNAVQATFRGGSGDAFVTKLSATGGFVYSTYLGGSGFDLAWDFAVDTAGNAYVVGHTTSTNFPTANAVQSTFGGFGDAFVTKLNATGRFVYSTYLGGSDFEIIDDFAVDTSGNAYFVGSTDSTDFPAVNAVQPAPDEIFVTKLSATGGFVYSTYLGGSGFEFVRHCAVGTSGHAYVVGHTTSTDFPTANAVQSTFGGGFDDAFVTKLNAAGGFVYSTYLGGDGFEFIDDVAVNTSGNAYLVGYTDSTDFPTANAVQPTLGGLLSNAFVAKIADGLDLEGVIARIQAITAANPGTVLEDKLQDVEHKLLTALRELQKGPPDRQAAAGSIEGAVGDMEATVKDGLLDTSEGTELMDALAGICRQMAQEAIDQAVAEGEDSSKIAEAQELLAAADALRGSGQFKAAVIKYKDAIAKAESD